MDNSCVGNGEELLVFPLIKKNICRANIVYRAVYSWHVIHMSKKHFEVHKTDVALSTLMQSFDDLVVYFLASIPLHRFYNIIRHKCFSSLAFFELEYVKSSLPECLSLKS